ncbi:phospholipid/cholesterol/gamma-HCH transport system substrate-binding protein [Herbaspirillum sp. Sphag1AN]|uniref:MlaD family protein n=1 Tax=unclassified Herbaspirillum TaxID=2624150 RepID=UPI00160CC8F4|nr:MULTISPECIES: MlaD family protein [unclassified Herbaspirillum]MBB3213395.1 phospholipid/cholesterol/gamma-HCH transport system substrate-binding protein [Herbaspirillum sp. Sphag1AN]MBB3246561.1 phospholipid/cholesterol/gamma-HCH transport system substrate-binding protein [Herbaspirillum sp. Sphag64]
MESRAHHVLIGVFTVAVVVAALLFSLWLSGLGGDRSVNFYTVIFNQAVNGLSRGSTVQYSGIKVGDVVQLTLDPNDTRRVLARIRVVGHIPIRQDTGAKLIPAGITGTSVIQLTNGAPESPLLVSKNDDDPVIVAVPSTLTAALSNGEDIMNNLNTILSNAQQFMSPDNARNLALSLEHLAQLSGALAQQRDHFGELVRQMKNVSYQTNLVMLQTNHLLSGPGTEAMHNLQQATTSLAVSSKQIETLISENQGTLKNGVQSIAEIGPMLVELRGTLASVRSIARSMENNPRRFLLGRDNLQEFAP